MFRYLRIYTLANSSSRKTSDTDEKTFLLYVKISCGYFIFALESVLVWKSRKKKRHFFGLHVKLID